eukprot:5732519-Ditylum_brightwellii.AAC.1
MFWAVGDVERDEATKACRVAVVVVKALTDGTNASSAHNNLDVFIVSSLLSARREERIDTMPGRVQPQRMTPKTHTG